MFVKIDLPPGLLRNGTAYGSTGRWFDADLMRFFEGQKKPIGGWAQRSVGTVSGAPRAMLTWRGNDSTPRALIGTHSNLYVMDLDGTLHDITPVGLVAGLQSQDAAHDATVWSLDTWGQFPVGVSPADGKLYQWDLNNAHPAAQISNAPTCIATVVTADRIQMALGASGDPRLVAWCDQEDNTNWTDSETNQAGSFPLQTSGKLMCGRKVTAGTLLLTDQDAWLAAYVGFPLVYGFQRVGTDCGPVSRGAVVVAGANACWMGTNSFWTFNGEVQPLPCEVSDLVFANLNLDQASKVTAWHNSDFGEVWWFYPDKDHVENERYVAWSYRENHWTTGQIRRASGVSKGVFPYPLLVGNTGIVWDHERGYDYIGAVSPAPYLRSAPLEMGSGDQVVTVKSVIPDEGTEGGVTVTLRGRLYPDASFTDYGPYNTANPTDVRFTARQVQITFTGAEAADWRIGTFRLDVETRGRR